ncbi:hypothetical protein [Alkalihalobacillus sp. BA299]|uniref:hypothetical protein n=1 Tax=Alkalihalobacillus sp. BA299 TaxID=2815938 RepID=UPI001ADCB150|nr:hypothetical protein [Alkalihalobacillus sp. BA299]
MDLISTHNCIEVEQKIEFTKKYTIEKNFDIELYSDKIRLKEKEFLLENVFDISYRKVTKEIGFLYLHTNQGVIPSLVKTDPISFIDNFRKIKRFY